MDKPFAFLLLKWADAQDEPISVAEAEILFTQAGRGRPYLVDWFVDNSHGNVDMTGNRVFGWLSLPETRAEHLAKRPIEGRERVVGLARTAAADAGIDLSGFAGIVAVTNQFSDLYGGYGPPGFVETTAERGPGHRLWESKIAPAVLCQEMIHALGIYEHTRAKGEGDYTDPYDVMSMFNAYTGVHPEDPELSIGPGLNAAFMDRCGWLDPARTQVVEEKRTTVHLRPLHRRDLAGPLCARLGPWYVEYRPRQGWDTGFPSSVVLVHEQADNTSYLIAALRTGEGHVAGQKHVALAAHREVRVESIDDEAATATVVLTDVASSLPTTAGPVLSLTADFGDGGGLALLGGRIIRIPPRSPSFQLLERIADLQALAEVPAPVEVATVLQRRTLEQIATITAERLEAIAGVATPAEAERSGLQR